jgi:hypothetical protein
MPAPIIKRAARGFSGLMLQTALCRGWFGAGQ